ncbi:hypothetical protein D3C76_568290 [compost metagenome]
MLVLQVIDLLRCQPLLAHSAQWPQCTQGVDDDRHINALLHNSTDKRRQITQGRHHHGQQRHAHADQHTLAGDVTGLAGNVQCLHQTIETVYQQHHTRGLCRSRGTTGPHGHADVGRRQRGGIIDAIADHQGAGAQTPFLHRSHFVLRDQPCSQLVNPGGQRNHFGGFQAIASEHDDPLYAPGAQAAQGLRRFSTHVVRKHQQAGKFSIHVNKASTARQVIHMAQHGCTPIGCRCVGMSKRQRAETHPPAIDHPAKAGARTLIHLSGDAQRQLTLVRGVDNGLADGVRRGLRQRSGQAKQTQGVGKSIDLD